MFEEALPFWAANGQDHRGGGPIESLALDASGPSAEAFKRLRVSCRQLYVFSHAEVLGWRNGADAADHHFAFLQKAWGGPEKGWPRTLDLAGAPLDTTPDLYDYAFVLFALGWRWRARKDKAALDLAHATMDLIDTRFAHPSGGFHHVLPPALPRQQNPHMHMTEAALVLLEGTGETRWRKLADDLVMLFKSRIARLPSGVLPEFFDDDWNPVPDEPGRIVEPGHQLEWAWILAQHQRLTGADNAGAIMALVQFAESHGVDPVSRAVYNAISNDGAVIDAGSRTWPNTERVKGWLGLAEITAQPPSQPVVESINLLFERYINPAPRGCWIDRYDADGRPSAATIPTSTFYHLFLAFAEALRLKALWA
jgi:N-acylglucosamine 2-epimerase/mannose-6-phosphate isomerase